MKLTLRKELFWDMDADTLDERIHQRYIVRQVIMFGTLDEFRTILSYYGLDAIRESIKKAGYLDPKTFSFVTTILDIDKNEMLCYTKKQLRLAHWN